MGTACMQQGKQMIDTGMQQLKALRPWLLKQGSVEAEVGVGCRQQLKMLVEYSS